MRPSPNRAYSTPTRRAGAVVVAPILVVLATVASGCARVGTAGPGEAPVPSNPNLPDAQPAAETPRSERGDRQPPSEATAERPTPVPSATPTADERNRASADRGAPEGRPISEESAALSEGDRFLLAHRAWLNGPDEIQESAYAVNDDIQERIDFWLEFWQGRGRSHFTRYLDRMVLYRPIVDRELMERDLPPTLRFLPVIESGYNPVAVSRVGATGLWQFMSPTARWLGLRVDGFVDERRDPYRATETALDYLVSLREQFDSWFLALAAYNSGPGRVSGILRRNARDAERGDSLFWALSQNFPTETSFFVPKLLAAAELASHPTRYGFDAPNPADSLVFEHVDVQGATSLDVVAKASGASLEDVVGLNPQLVQRVTPINTIWTVRVPLGKSEGFAERLAEVPPDERVTFIQHRVASGETLGHIAGRYGIRVSQLRAANPGIRPRSMQIGQRLIIPKGPATSAERLASTDEPDRSEPADALRSASADSNGRETASAAAGTTGADTADEGITVHTVRSGDSPWTISRRYGVALDDLLAWNDLNRRSVLRPGDQLQVRGAAATVSSVYRVQSGDTLSEIAERHGVTTRALIQENGMSSRSVIRPGQRLRIPTSG